MLKGALIDVAPQADDARIDVAASTIIATMDGLQVQWLLDPKAVDMAEAVRLLIAALIAQLNSEPQ
jgi:hypothetical protein